MNEIKTIGRALGQAADGSLMFFCNGCDEPHRIQVGDGPGPRWGYNGNPNAPTFTPSVLAKGVQQVTDEEHATLMAGGHVEPRPFVCHSFITDGRIQFLGDSSNHLAGQTVDLPDWEESWNRW
ncbi:MULTISPECIES: DUF6527 family protein [unclassified Pseudomonas]|uniref:DUF6527 family protein n=1 Tax=unclassified Pseudomonas TaxID=196821 RepID=UPI000C2FC1FC|nr:MULTISPECIES: DUF6527 family protein [unclassified Pseudomonas]MCU1736238.1 DUF6527 family protein [Pseudomonas sp. 20S_6.2_Bac1]